MVALRSSKALESAGYDPATGILRVRFRHGGLYDYHGVPPQLFEALRRDAHPWTRWGAHIKATYAVSRVG